MLRRGTDDHQILFFSSIKIKILYLFMHRSDDNRLVMTPEFRCSLQGRTVPLAAPLDHFTIDDVALLPDIFDCVLASFLPLDI